MTYSKQFVKKECGENEKTRPHFHLLDSLIGSQNISEEDFRKALNSSAVIFHQQGNLIAIIEFYLHIVSYYKQIANPSDEQIKSLTLFYIPLGVAHEELGMWNRAMDFYFEALALAETYRLDPVKSMIYNNLGTVHYRRNELEKAEFYLLKAIEINQKAGIKKELFNNYNNLAGVYINRKEYNQALDYSLLAIQQLNYKEDIYSYYGMQTNIANIYFMKKDYKLAISYLLNAMEYQEKQGFTNDLVQTYVLFSNAYEMLGAADSAHVYMEKALYLAKYLNNKHIESRILQEAARYHERNNQPKAAYQALKEAYMINDSISMIDNQQKTNDLEKMYAAEKKIRENELQIKNITLQKLASDRLWIISASVALSLIIVVLYLINYSKNKEKERKNEELLLQHQAELHEKEKELQRRKEQELNYTIDEKNRELTSYTLYMIKNNELITELKNELKQLLIHLNPKDRQNREQIRQLLNKLSHQHSTDNWGEFSYYFEKVHPSFYHNLEKRYPDLTPKEKRLCAFLELGLSSKEISAITFKEVRSVESARNRLRKKLKISQDDNITEFLHNTIA
ncbi:MAG: tetratricopeptide repeat protein [Dysgonamonadaceae bacterium]|nr:tetratricopeptide repeat protein [Dysgonamonadaceae bacterium]